MDLQYPLPVVLRVVVAEGIGSSSVGLCCNLFFAYHERPVERSSHLFAASPWHPSHVSFARKGHLRLIIASNVFTLKHQPGSRYTHHAQRRELHLRFSDFEVMTLVYTRNALHSKRIRRIVECAQWSSLVVLLLVGHNFAGCIRPVERV